MIYRKFDLMKKFSQFSIRLEILHFRMFVGKWGSRLSPSKILVKLTIASALIGSLSSASNLDPNPTDNALEAQLKRQVAELQAQLKTANSTINDLVNKNQGLSQGLQEIGKKGEETAKLLQDKLEKVRNENKAVLAKLDEEISKLAVANAKLQGINSARIQIRIMNIKRMSEASTEVSKYKTALEAYVKKCGFFLKDEFSESIMDNFNYKQINQIFDQCSSELATSKAALDYAVDNRKFLEQEVALLKQEVSGVAVVDELADAISANAGVVANLHKLAVQIHGLFLENAGSIVSNFVGRIGSKSPAEARFQLCMHRLHFENDRMTNIFMNVDLAPGMIRFFKSFTDLYKKQKTEAKKVLDSFVVVVGKDRCFEPLVKFLDPGMIAFWNEEVEQYKYNIRRLKAEFKS